MRAQSGSRKAPRRQCDRGGEQGAGRIRGSEQGIRCRARGACRHGHRPRRAERERQGAKRSQEVTRTSELDAQASEAMRGVAEGSADAHGASAAGAAAHGRRRCPSLLAERGEGEGDLPRRGQLVALSPSVHLSRRGLLLP